MNLPEGDVTLLFTDIEGSTNLWEVHPEAMQQALEVHRSGELRSVNATEHLAVLTLLAERKNLKALREALRQRYP